MYISMISSLEPLLMKTSFGDFLPVLHVFTLLLISFSSV